MTSYVAFLRGINVGGNKMVAMAELRAMLEALGFTDVKTLLQSGNAVFRGAAKPPAKLEQQLEAATAKRIGVTCDYHVRTAAELREAIDANPLTAEAKKDPARLLVSFYRAPLDKAAVKAAQAAISGPRPGRACWWHGRTATRPRSPPETPSGWPLAAALRCSAATTSAPSNRPSAGTWPCST